MTSTLYLIDGHALAYRTYFALTSGGTNSARWLTNSGEPTAGVYGFTSVLLRLLEQERPDYLAVCFDTGKTFRDKLFPEYKATREKMPEDLRPQIERIRNLVDTFNIPRAELEGYEADDVLGSLANWAVGKGLAVKIITGDRDLLQLVNERITVNLPGKSLSDARDYFREDVKESLGVWPEQVVDYKALIGDRSDNIPGVYGVGKKTAVMLLEEYQTLDQIYQNIDVIPGRFQTKLAEGKDSAYLSQKLARIVSDLNVEIDLEQAKPDRFDPLKVRELFRTLEFGSLLNRLATIEEIYGKTVQEGQMDLFTGGSDPSPQFLIEKETPGTINVEVITTKDQLIALGNQLRGASQIAFDTETTSTDQMQAELVGISLAITEDGGYYIPVGHQSGKQLPLESVLAELQEPLTNPSIPKLGHNLKYDYIMLARAGLKVYPLSFDSMIAEWLINPSSRNLGLKKLAWVRLNQSMNEIETLIGKGKSQITMAEVSIEDAAKYAVEDALMVLLLKPMLEQELAETESTKLYQEIEMPLVSVLAGMEMEGIGLDTDFLVEMSAQLEVDLKKLETQIFQMVGEEFNLNSPKQLSEALFLTLGLTPPPRGGKTASGYYSTAADVLETLKKEHQVPAWVLEYREYSKLKSTYVDALPLQVNPKTLRVHTSYNQTGSVTGRIASTDPNLQNIPIRTELGNKVRKAFVAAPGWSLVAVDYSQIELRVAAHMANDQAMLAAFREGKDIHTATAAAIFDIPLDKVTSQQRREAKAINFGLIYGMSSFGLTQTTDLTLAEAETFVETYFQRFPGIKTYLDNIRKQAAEYGYVKTLLGRKRYFPSLATTTDHNLRRREEREAINAPIQGTAADIMKLAMIAVADQLKESDLLGRMLLQVHDELVLEVPENEVETTIKLVQSAMEDVYSLEIPLTTDAQYGRDWGSLVKYTDMNN
ncbi:MAG: DNA polymerase I [Anaerolineales bacterium]|nr:DNA polymerase I [Anaerolineales bacterium]